MRETASTLETNEGLRIIKGMLVSQSNDVTSKVKFAAGSFMLFYNLPKFFHWVHKRNAIHPDVQPSSLTLSLFLLPLGKVLKCQSYFQQVIIHHGKVLGIIHLVRTQNFTNNKHLLRAYQRVRNVHISENFAYMLNELSIMYLFRWKTNKISYTLLCVVIMLGINDTHCRVL